MFKFSRIIIYIILINIFINCKKQEEVALLTAPITFAIAKHAIQMGKKDGDYKIHLTYSNIHKENNDWPHGELQYIVESTEYPGKVYTIQYILNGSHIATAITIDPKSEKKQFQINLVENAIVFGQTETVEKELQALTKEMTRDLEKNRKIAIFDFPGTLNEKTILGRRISESITTFMVKEKFQVVERKLLDPMFKEASFQESGLVGEDIRFKLGKLIGANTVLTGTIKFERHEILINARIIDLESGNILAAGQRIIPKYYIQEKDLLITTW